MSLAVAALLAWLLTAALGSSLFITWLARGGVSQQPRTARMALSLPPPYFPAPLVVSHLLLAVGGLVQWVAYLLTDANTLAWSALATLLPVALLGFSMFGRWVGSRRARVAAAPGWTIYGPAESRLPSVIVLSHGMSGATTLGLVLLTAMGVGGS